MNERKTEDIVISELKRHGYFESGSTITVEKQSSDTPRIQKLLANASKRGMGVGHPEFLIHSHEKPGFIIVIECKASPAKHISESLCCYADYAVDGVLLYASFLSKEFDVLAIAISGEDSKSCRISHYLHLRGQPKAESFDELKGFISFGDYYEALINSGAKFRQDYNALLDYSRTLNNQLQAKKVTESERAFLISGILISLQNKAFLSSYKAHKTSKALATSLINTIRTEFEGAKLPEDKLHALTEAFSFIPGSPAINDRDFFISLIEGVDENINAFMRTHAYYDTIGHFYIEFLRYANNDKGLGIVLTPSHIAELFADLASVDHNSLVYDNCCGTAGLMIAAMKVMIRDAGGNRQIKERVRSSQLFGIEFQPKVYALAVSNMILHGDGKTNLLRGDCFIDGSRLLSDNRPTVGILNPPYKNKRLKTDKEELEFVFNNLEFLRQDGICVAIVPITCATVPSGEGARWKQSLLERHTLEAVLSMPIELFHNSKTNVVTCVMVFRAGRPHPKGKKTWFGYCRDDGFIKTKHRGRVDLNGSWEKIRDFWINAYRNREVIDGFSVMKEVGVKDEWCAEAYLDTNYELISKSALIHASKKYVLSKAMLKHASS